eukprot:88024-Amphidinium_carterae.1
MTKLYGCGGAEADKPLADRDVGCLAHQSWRMGTLFVASFICGKGDDATEGKPSKFAEFLIGSDMPFALYRGNASNGDAMNKLYGII